MNTEKLSIIFAGTPEFSLPALEKINLAGYEIKLVLTQPDRKSGRGMNIKKSPVKQKAIELNIPLCQPEFLKNNIEVINKSASKKASILIVVAYGLIIPDEILNLFNAYYLKINKKTFKPVFKSKKANTNGVKINKNTIFYKKKSLVIMKKFLTKSINEKKMQHL